jgi:hypothetical protein
MRVRFFANDALAFDDWGRCAKIEGPMFRILLKQFIERKKTTTKSERVIAQEIVAGWPTGWLDWVDIKEANR